MNGDVVRILINIFFAAFFSIILTYVIRFLYLRISTGNLFNDLERIAKQLGDLKINETTKENIRQYFWYTAYLINKARDGDEYRLKLASHWVHNLKVLILSFPEGKGEEITLPKLGDISIKGSDIHAEIIQKAGISEETVKESPFMRIITTFSIVLAIVAALLQIADSSLNLGLDFLLLWSITILAVAFFSSAATLNIVSRRQKRKRE